MQDRITINGVDYQRTGTIKVNDEFRNIVEAVGFDLDRLIQAAKEIQADYAEQGLTHNSLENEGYLRGLLTVKGTFDYHVADNKPEETPVVANEQTVSHIVVETLTHAILQSPEGFYWIGERDDYLTHQTAEPPFVWVAGNYDNLKDAYKEFQTIYLKETK